MYDVTMQIIKLIKKQGNPTKLDLRKAEALWNADGIRITMQQMQPDSVDVENAKGDVFDPKHNPDVNPSQLAADEALFEARIQDEGMHGLVAERRIGTGDGDDAWEHVDSIFGFVGHDGLQSGYDADLLASLLKGGDK
jgi:hypothetical protein